MYLTSQVSHKRIRYFVTIEYDGIEEQLVIIAESPEDMKSMVNKLYRNVTLKSPNLITFEQSNLL